MKRMTALLLALTLVLSLVACAKPDSPTDTTSDAPTTNPTVPTSESPATEPADPTPEPPATDPTDPPPEIPSDPEPSTSPEPNYQDLQVATQLIRNYTWYLAVGICCEFELVTADLSAFLSDSQKYPYFNHQYKLLCCDTPEEVRNQIDRTMVKDLQVCGYPDDRLFTDDQGTLYLIIIPTGYVGYRDVTIAKSGDCLYAKAGAFAEDGWFADTYFTIETVNGTQMITQVLRSDINEIPAQIKDLPFCAPADPSLG